MPTVGTSAHQMLMDALADGIFSKVDTLGFGSDMTEEIIIDEEAA